MSKTKYILGAFVFALLFTLTTQALASVTISGTSLVGDSSFNAITGVTSGTIDLGSGQTLNLQTTNNGPITTGTGLLTVNGTLALGANSLTMTGSLGATGARLTKGWFTDLQVTNAIAGSVTGNAGTSTTATNIAGGAGGSIPYQSAAGTTQMLANGSAGQVLTSNGTTLAPSWTTIGGGSGDMILASIQTITGAKTFGTIGGAVGKFILAGSTSGSTILNAAAIAGSTTITLPASSGTLMLNSDDTTGKSAKTDALNSASTIINVSSATAPTNGQVLTATSGTTATWQTPSGGGGSVNVNGSSVSSPNFNATTPAAGAGYTNATFQVSGSNVSAEVPSVLPTDLGAIAWSNTGTATFAAASSWAANATITTTTGQSMTLSPTGLLKWGTYNLEIINGSSTAAVLTLGTAGSCSAWKVAGGGGGAITLTGSSAIDWLSFTFDGTNCVAWFSNNHS